MEWILKIPIYYHPTFLRYIMIFSLAMESFREEFSILRTYHFSVYYSNKRESTVGGQIIADEDMRTDDAR